MYKLIMQIITKIREEVIIKIVVKLHNIIPSTIKLLENLHNLKNIHHVYKNVPNYVNKLIIRLSNVKSNEIAQP